MLTTCTIKFDNRESGVFFAGDVIACSVVLETSKPKSLKEISATAIGKSKVRFKSGFGGDAVTYNNEMTYLDLKTIIKNNPEGDTIDLMPGIHSYNFEMQLPDTLPSSYQGQYGETVYEMKITLARGWEFDNEFVKPFTVIYPVDLNKNIEFQNPTSEIQEITSYLNCFTIKPIKITVQTPYSGYIPGQSIPVTVDVLNLSGLNCRKIVVKLHRHAQFLGAVTSRYGPVSKSKYVRTKLIKLELPEVQTETNKSFTRLLTIPATPPTSPQIFDVIRIWYTITVEAVVGLFQHSLKTYTPMTIGTIPLMESTEGDTESSSLDNAPFLTYTSRFEQSHPEKKYFVDKDKSVTYEPFAPKYPVFKN